MSCMTEQTEKKTVAKTKTKNTLNNTRIILPKELILIMKVLTKNYYNLDKCVDWCLTTSEERVFFICLSAS